MIALNDHTWPEASAAEGRSLLAALVDDLAASVPAISR